MFPGKGALTDFKLPPEVGAATGAAFGFATTLGLTCAGF